MLSNEELKQIHKDETRLLYNAHHDCDYEMIRYYDGRLRLIEEILM